MFTKQTQHSTTLNKIFLPKKFFSQLKLKQFWCNKVHNFILYGTWTVFLLIYPIIRLSFYTHKKNRRREQAVKNISIRQHFNKPTIQREKKTFKNGEQMAQINTQFYCKLIENSIIVYFFVGISNSEANKNCIEYHGNVKSITLNVYQLLI